MAIGNPGRILAIAVCCAAGIRAQDWPNYGADPGETHFSPLDQINRGNVALISGRHDKSVTPARTG